MKNISETITNRVYHSICSEIIEMIESNTVNHYNHYSHFVLNIPSIKMLINISYE